MVDIAIIIPASPIGGFGLPIGLSLAIDLGVKVRDLCDDLDPEMITSLSAPSMKGELDVISTARDSYRQAVRD